MVSKGASFARGASEQDVGTPDNFLDAVRRRFGELHWDLAATEQNSVCDGCFYGPGGLLKDSLSVEWATSLRESSTLWLNPPYSNIAPWAEKSATCWQRPGWLLMLVPASTGAMWFQKHVVPFAFVLELVGRLTFKGHTGSYPKDLILACYGFGLTGRAPWHWRVTP